MAFFKFRKSADEQPGQAAQSESVEAMRKRATFRLIGAAVLVLAGVIGFPLVFDSQPRPIPVDIAIEIPDKTKVKPLALPAPGARLPSVGTVTAPVANDASTKAPAATASASPEAAADAKKSIDTKVQQEKQLQADKKIEKSAIVKEEIIEKKDQKNQVKSKSNDNDGDRALALLDGKTASKSTEKPAPPAAAPAAAVVVPAENNENKTASKADSRFVVQVGAYSDSARAKEARAKLESAGLKTYAQVIETKDGPRTRVRVGPFSDRAEADRVAQKVKSLDLPAAILAL